MGLQEKEKIELIRERWKANLPEYSEKTGVGIVFMSPEGEVVSFSFKLVFDCTNNVAEYSALLIGLELAILAGIRKLPML